MFKNFDRTDDVERSVPERGVFQLAFEDRQGTNFGSDVRRDIDSLNLELTFRSDEEVTPSTAEIEESSRARELHQTPKTILRFSLPIEDIIGHLPLAAAGELWEPHIDLAKALLGRSCMNIEGVTLSALNDEKPVPHYSGVERPIGARWTWHLDQR